MTIPRELLDELWKPEYLERLARAYWRWISRVDPRPDPGRLRRGLALGRAADAGACRCCASHAPEYETGRRARQRDLARSSAGCSSRARGATRRLPADRGRPHAPSGRGRRRGDARRSGSRSATSIPGCAGSGRFARFGAWLYGQTQLRIHVLVCNGFLRSLARARPAAVAGRRARRRDRRRGEDAEPFERRGAREDDGDDGRRSDDPGHRRDRLHRRPARPRGCSTTASRSAAWCAIPSSDAAAELERARLRARGRRPHPARRARRRRWRASRSPTSSST